MHRSESKPPTSSRRWKKRSTTSRFLIISIGLSVGYVLLNDQESQYQRATSDISHFASEFLASSTSTTWNSYETDLSIPNSEKWSCAWSPDNHARCDEILSKITNELREDHLTHQRWIFFGDSTMKRLFDLSDLKERLISQPNQMVEKKCLDRVTCTEQQQEDRCGLNSVYGLPHIEEWISPDPFKYEGPFRYGAVKRHASCTDCSGCQTHFLECSFDSSIEKGTDCNSDGNVYGGYMTMEFARDRELQTPEFGTTQENIAAYLSQKWNTPELVEDWGKPICVFSGGNHDIILPGIRREHFIANVQWMLEMLQSECHHLIWLSNTPNKQKMRYPQHLRIMKSWDNGVKEIIAADQELLSKSTFIDVLDASLKFSRADNIHMEDKWYVELGRWFTSFM